MAKIAICFYLTNDLTKSYQVIHTMEIVNYIIYTIFPPNPQAPTRYESVGCDGGLPNL